MPNPLNDPDVNGNSMMWMFDQIKEQSNLLNNNECVKDFCSSCDCIKCVNTRKDLEEFLKEIENGKI